MWDPNRALTPMADIPLERSSKCPMDSVDSMLLFSDGCEWVSRLWWCSTIPAQHGGSAGQRRVVCQCGQVRQCPHLLVSGGQE